MFKYNTSSTFSMYLVVKWEVSSQVRLVRSTTMTNKIIKETESVKGTRKGKPLSVLLYVILQIAIV